MRDTFYAILGVLAILVLGVTLVIGIQHRSQVKCDSTCAPRHGVIRGRDYLCFCETVLPDGRKVLEMQ
jgi:hypothetical protein